MYEIFLPQLTYMIVLIFYFHLRWSKQNVRRIREHGVQCARFSGADMCWNCSLSVKSTKLGGKIVFNVLMDI